MTKPDPKALQVAEAVRLAEQPELTILFGSRARGDHREPSSDIDIMLIQDQLPEGNYQKLATHRAETTAKEAYGRDVFVQLVWRTIKEFRHNRRYVNSIETRAAREGAIMPRDPENYSRHDYEDENTESEVSWTAYQERLTHAEQHLTSFNIICQHTGLDLVIGQQAQNALEHSMKALLETLPDASYHNTHDIGELLGNIRHFDRQLQDFRLSIPPDVYSEYEGDRQYRPRTQPNLTDFPDFQERTVKDIEFIINRARQVRASRIQE